MRPLPGMLLVLAVVMAALAVALGSACNAPGFEPVSRVDTVRILASSADKPYAMPGDTVNLTVLAYDGRGVQPEPMRIWWLPIACFNPPSDEYYQCFAQAADGGTLGDAGAGGGGFPKIGPGVDLTPFLTEGPTFSITLPRDIITSHKSQPGQSTPYGIAIAFNIACAGHVEIVARDPNNVSPLQVPVGCFDKDHNALGADAWVLGFTRVYAYTNRTNTNPVISQVTYDGMPVDTTVGIQVDHCTASKDQDCPTKGLDVMVPPSSQEPNPDDVNPDGTARKEQIWVDYYATSGELADDARLLYDPAQGQITDTATKYAASQRAGDGVLWAVVHDNRGGTSWAQWTVHAK